MPSVSVVVNTYNRAASLAATLDGLALLTHQDFEIIVVNGPSNDDTDIVLSRWSGRIKVGRCANPNLSESRNIGIAIAAGEFVAFIDDDAYPDPDWLTDLCPGFQENEVAAVGGPVYDHTGAVLQCGYSMCNRFGAPFTAEGAEHNPTLYGNRPLSGIIPYPIGTNSVFRRNMLVEVGGFDEEFEYHHDETDVCARLLDRGYAVNLLDRGFVYHKYLASTFRGDDRVFRDRYMVLKSTAYFALKHGLVVGSFYDVCAALTKFVEAHRADVLANIARGVLTETDLKRFEADVHRGFDDALAALPTAGSRTRSTEWFASRQTPFLAFERPLDAAQRRHIVLFSDEAPPRPLNGIGRLVTDLARSLAAAGHLVRVFTRGEHHDRVDLEQGVWVHRVVPRTQPLPTEVCVPQDIWDYSSSLLRELHRMDRAHQVDIVQIPNWDAEGIAVILDGGFTTCLGLYTSLATIATMDPRMAPVDQPGDRQQALLELERYSYTHATHLIASSSSILEEIERCFGLDVEEGRVSFVPLGISDRSESSTDWNPSPQPADESRVDILFVGRLEPRKGVDVLLEAIDAVVDRHGGVRLLIAGDDSIAPDGVTYRELFESRHAGSALLDHVLFLGRVPDEQLGPLYHACDIFVSPSRFESFGLTALEAMMFAKPVVASDGSGLARVVDDGVTGILVPPADSKRLADALSRLVSDPLERRGMGGKGRLRYEANFTAAQMAGAMLKVYNRFPSGPPDIESMNAVVEDTLSDECVTYIDRIADLLQRADPPSP